MKMSNQPTSSTTNSAPATPGTSSQGKTQVFILTPDILKKLGIASKIPGLTANSIANVPTTQEDKIKLEDSMKNRLALALNKKINVNKNVTETKVCDNVDDVTKQNEKEENSVKTKLLSMLTSKLEKEKEKRTTSNSLESTIDKQTTNFNNQINPKEKITLNLNETNTKLAETPPEINTKHDTVQNVNESLKNKQTLTKKLIETDIEPSQPSTSFLKNILTRESAVKSVNNSNRIVTSTTVTKESKGNKTCIIETQKHINLEKPESKSTPKGRKRKLFEEIPPEDPDLVSPIRKSGRKRKLSTLHSDYVTELKLHDGSNKKISNRTRKSVDVKCIENLIEHVTGDSDNLNGNNNIKKPESNIQQNFATETNIISSNESNNNADLNNTVCPIQSPKKQIIIHENILLKSPISSLNIVSLSQNNTVDSSDNITGFVINKDIPENDPDTTVDFKVKSPLKTYSNKIKGRLSTEEKVEIIKSTATIEPGIEVNALPEKLSTDEKYKLEATSVVPTEINQNISEIQVVAPLKTYPAKIKGRISTDSEPKEETQKAINQVLPAEINQHISEIKVIKPDPPKFDSSSTETSKSSIQETKPEMKSPETIVLVRRRRSRPGKDNSAANMSALSQKINSANLAEFETFYSSTVVGTEKVNANNDESETVESSIGTTETNATQNTGDVKQKILTSFETEALETTKICNREQNTDNEPKTVESPIDIIETNTIHTTEDTKQKILTDFETKAPETTKIRNRERLKEQNKNTEVETVTNESPTATNSAQTMENANEKLKILADFETKAPETTDIRIQERLEKQKKNSDALPVTMKSSTEINTTQTTDDVKQKILTDFKTNAPETTDIRNLERLEKQNKNTVAAPETVETPIDITETKGRTKVLGKIAIRSREFLLKQNKNNESEPNVHTETNTTQNIEQQKILTDFETKVPEINPIPFTIRGRPRLEKQNKNIELEIVATPTVETKCSQIIQPANDSKTPNIRRKGRPPKQNKNNKDPTLETIDSPTVSTETIANQTLETIILKQEELSVPEPITPIRRRGRPPKKKQDFEAESSPIITNEILDETTDTEKTPNPKRGRGRQRKTVPVDEETQENETETPENESKFLKIPSRGKPKKRGRLEMEEDLSNKPKTVTCAICNEDVPRIHWINHTMKHNFLCWQVGEPAINLKDRKLVEYILHKALKDNPRFKHFICPTCSDKKKSVLGFLSHIELCQLTDEERLALMESCTVCNKKVMPQSMKTHMKTHDDYMSRGGISAEELVVENPFAPRTKRKAATKAANLIQEVTNEEDAPIVVKKEVKLGKKNYKKGSDKGSVFITFGVIKKLQVDFNKGSTKCKYRNCEFECKDFADLKEHVNTCPTIEPDDYICRYCLFIDKDENVMKTHVHNQHLAEKEDYRSDPSGSDSDDEDYGDNEILVSDDETNTSILASAKKLTKPPTEYIRPTFKIGFLARERRIIRNPVCTYYPALRWTYEFCRENYSKVLFENIKCLSSKWRILSLNEQEKYVPLLKKSMGVKCCEISRTIPNFQNVEHEWKEYDLYETEIDNDTATIFCGGPIWALAWVPTPLSLISDQYLAVSLQKDFEATYKISESPPGREVIQFWNFGPLECKETLKNSPTLEFSIAHNHGMVWYMEWCASGYYDINEPSDPNELKKLGLLALACSDGNIPIYAIGLPPEEELKKNNIYDIKPAFKLILQQPLEQLLGQWKYQVTKISWSKSSGHNIIAGGYSNGMVCLWDLGNTSPLLKSEEKDVIILKPYQSFQAHTSAISALVLYPLIDEGKRWLLTGSWDRTFKYWDVNNTANPVSSFGKRGIITDGVWISHWLCSFFGFDDVFSLGHTVTTVQNPRDFGFKQCSALASNSVVMSLSANDWASAIAQGTLAGELITTFPRTILISYDVDKHLKCKRMMLSYNEIIDKTKDPSERKDLMKTEKKPEKLDNEKDDKLFSRYFDSKDIEPYVEEPSAYVNAREKYGMLFCDFKLTHFNLLPPESLDAVKQSLRLREVPTEMYPFTSLNRLVWNPNKQAYLYVASGYQNGFVRLRCIRFMNSNQATTILNEDN